MIFQQTQKSNFQFERHISKEIENMPSNETYICFWLNRHLRAYFNFHNKNPDTLPSENAKLHFWHQFRLKNGSFPRIMLRNANKVQETNKDF